MPTSDELIGERRPAPGLIGAPEAGAATRPPEEEPVTGPTPTVSFADGQLAVHTRRGAAVVAVDGGLDLELAERLAPHLADVAATAAAVVLDLDHATLLERGAVEALVAVLDAAAIPSCLVAGRLSGRLVLEKWEVDGRRAVFSSVSDALQARAFGASGYGPGWDPLPSSR